MTFLTSIARETFQLLNDEVHLNFGRVSQWRLHQFSREGFKETEHIMPFTSVATRLVTTGLSPLIRRAKRTLNGDAPTANIFLLHIPKCGGQSMQQALRHRFMAHGQPAFKLNSLRVAQAAELAGRRPVDLCRDLLILQLVSQENGFIAGHYPFSLNAWTEFHERWKFITVLRDPVNRWFSNYFYSRSKPHSHLRPITEGLEEFIDTERAVAFGRTYVRYLSEKGDVDEALGNLDRFDLVGTLERLPEFLNRLERMSGTSFSVGHRNKSPLAAHQQQELITCRLRARVEELCEPDMRVYEHASRIGSALTSPRMTL